MKGKEKNKKNLEKTKQEPKKDLIKVKEKSDFGAVTRKWLAKTSLTVLLIGIIVLIYISLNLIIEKINPTDIDLTTDKVYSLSETSKSVIEKVENDVEMILVNVTNSAQSIVDFSHRYEKVNEKIKVKIVDDVSKEQELANEYNLTDTTTMIIIRTDEKEKILAMSDLYTWDYTTGEQKDITEEAITNAILDVTVAEKPKIYYLVGHNKYSDEYIQYFAQDLTEEANEIIALDLLTKGSVPEDASALMITTLAEDMTAAESAAIIKYIKKGGEIIIFSDPNVGKIEWKNFQKVLNQYGVSISEGIMVEQDENRMLSGSPSAILVTVSSSSSITNQTNMNMNACFMNAGKLTFKDAEDLEKLNVEVETLATTGDTAFYRSDLSIQSTEKQDGDEEGSATVGALLTKKINDDTTSKLIIYSNNMFITNVQIAISSQYYLYALDFYNNEDLALNSISYLTGREDTITIRKDTEISTYTVTEMQQNIILTIIFAIPALIIIAGIVVWQVRRRKK